MSLFINRELQNDAVPFIIEKEKIAVINILSEDDTYVMCKKRNGS